MSAPDHAPCSLDKLLLALTGASTHVHDDAIALAQFGDQDALDIGLEGVAIDRAVEREGRDHAAGGEARTKVVAFQWPCGTPTRSCRPRAQRPVGPGHVGRSPGLVDEGQALGIEIELGFEPGLAPLQDVQAALLGRVAVFLRVMAWRAKKRRIVP
jgi:hypothetical protein